MARRWPWLLIFLAPLIPLWRAVFLGEGIGPFDHIRAMAPWNGPAPSTAWDVLQADGVIQFYPWRDLVLSSWGRMEPPFWNPYQLAGTPLLANSQSAGFYPPHILLGLLHVPTVFAMALLAWFHLALAGGGAAMLAGRFGASKVGQAFAGVSFGLSPFLLAWTALPSVPSTVAWIPWALVAAYDSLRGNCRSYWLLTFFLAMMVLAGHLQFVAYGFFAVGLFALVEAVRLKAWKPFGGVLLGFVASFALAAVHLAPVLNYSQFSHRRNVASEEGYQAYVAGAIQPFEMVAIVFPELVGRPTQGLQVSGTEISSYWPALVKRGGNYAEGAVGLGVAVVFALFFLSRTQASRTLPLLILGGLSLLLALGTPLNRLLYFFVPGWSSTGSPGRISVLFVMAACIAAGSVFRDSEEEVSKRAVGTKLGAFAGFALLTLFSAFAIIPGLTPWIPGMPQELVNDVARSTLYMTVVGSIMMLVATLFTVYAWQKKNKPVAMILVPLAVGLITGLALIRTAPADLATQGPAQERIAVVGNQWDLLSRPNAVIPPNTASISRIHDLAGYDSLLHRDTVELLKDVDGEDPAPPANGNMMLVKRNADQAKLSAAGVTEVWTAGGKFPLPGPGRADVNGAPAQITSETLTGITLKANGPGRLTLRDRNLPGWTAHVDGKPAEIRGATWREVELPAGEHTVEFRYTPPGYALGLPISAIAWVAWAVGIFFTRRRPGVTEESSE